MLRNGTKVFFLLFNNIVELLLNQNILVVVEMY